MPAQQAPHSVSGSSTIAPQARQRGGSTPSTTARPIRRSWTGKVVESCIALDHPLWSSPVNRRLTNRTNRAYIFAVTTG
jgi:hypothetical protein